MLEDSVWAILDEYTWCVSAHLQGKGLTTLQDDGYMLDLFATETGEALAEMLSLVGDRIAPIVRMRTERYIHERILKYATDTFWWNNGCTNNWGAVCSGSVAMCAIYQEKDMERLADILAFHIANIQNNYYRGFSADGACLEGLSYWTYGFGYFTYFADLLKKRTNGEIDLFLDEPVKDIALFFGKCFFPNGATVAFSDGSAHGKYQPALAAYYHAMYPTEFAMPERSIITMQYPQDHCARFALLLRNFVWAADSLTPSEPASSTVHCLPDAQWYLASTRDGLGIAVKGGNNDEPHNHNDVGSFHIFKKGVELLPDLGAPQYDKFYFSKHRYEYFAACSRSHAVPVINNQYQKAGKDYKAIDVNLDDSGITMDIAPAYGIDTLSSLVRSVRFDCECGITTITDTFRFENTPERVVERFPLIAEPIITDGKATVTSAGETLEIRFDPAIFTPEVSFDFSKKHANHGKGVSEEDSMRKTYLLDLVVKCPEQEATYQIVIQ